MTADTPGEQPDERHEIDVLDPPPDTVTLENGMILRIKPLKARQFFKLLRIITHGGAQMLTRLQWTSLEDPDAFATQLVAVIVFAIPEAEQETIDFIISMIEFPEDEKLHGAIFAEISEPEIEDLFTIIENIVQREKGDLVALGKRLAKLWKVADKTGQIRSQTTASSEDGQGPSTSSAASTDGTTTESSTSPSPASVKSRKQSASV